MNFSHEMAVFIGRFQPFHTGHLSVIQQGLTHAPRMTVLVGSSFAPRSHRNPFTFEERKGFISASIEEAGMDPNRIFIMPLQDAAYNDEKWMTSVRETVGTTMGIEYGRTTGNVALIGHAKDHTSFYLNMFPEWKDAINVPSYLNLSATPMRSSYFSNIGHMWLADCDGHKDGDLEKEHRVPSAVRKFLMEFLDTPDYKAIREEYEFIHLSSLPYINLPFPPVFVTADACVVQSGHILLVRRKNHPGKGQWALPGGHVERHQTVEEAMLAELSQETTIGLESDIIRQSIVHKGVYDDPNRDPRGRYITHAFLIHLKRSRNLPGIEAADDAADAKWWPIPEIKREMMFLDHYDIFMSLVGRI